MSSSISLTALQKKLFSSFKIIEDNAQVEIVLKLHSSHLRTDTLPHTHAFLQLLTPSVLQTRCFNQDDLPFTDEVKNTELGHLLEHLILDYLAVTTPDTFGVSQCFQGITEWNWYEEPKGTFHIILKMGNVHLPRLDAAIVHSCTILDHILTPTQNTEAMVVPRCLTV